MIESEQLMKGDYVQFTDDREVIHIARVIQTMEFTCLIEYTTASGDYIELVIEYSKLSPVPLHSRILRRLGAGVTELESDPYFFIQPNRMRCFRWEDPYDRDDFTIDIGIEKDNYHITIFQRGKIAVNMLYDEKPVMHDLQHAIKICHINREINLLN